MQYTIIQGSLQYDESITEDIFNQLVKAAEAQGYKFNKHFSGGGETHAHFKKHTYLNFDMKNKAYQYGKVWVIDNNPQGLPKLTLKDLQYPDGIIDAFPIY